MSLGLQVGGAAGTLTGKAEYEDPANPGQFLVDPNGVATWEDTTPSGPGTVVAITDSGTTGGVSELKVEAVAAGDFQISGFATDPDGSKTPVAVYTDTVAAAAPPPPSTDATQFSISEGAPAPPV